MVTNENKQMAIGIVIGTIIALLIGYVLPVTTKPLNVVFGGIASVIFGKAKSNKLGLLSGAATGTMTAVISFILSYNSLTSIQVQPNPYFTSVLFLVIVLVMLIIYFAVIGAISGLVTVFIYSHFKKQKK